MARISVLLPIYNAMPYLPEALGSILGQTFSDFEVLALNDSSTDGSTEFLQSISDPRLRIFNLPKAGHTANLNFGLGEARAELIARMDADDIALPNRFAEQVSFLDRQPETVLCGSQVERIDPSGEYMDSWRFPVEDEILRYNLMYEPPFCHPGTMFRKQAALAVGNYNTEFPVAQDYDLWCRLAERGRLANLPSSLLRYRVRARSVSSSNRPQQIGITRRISQKYLLNCGYASSDDECESFWRCMRSDCGFPNFDDALVYATITERFVDSLKRQQSSESTISRIRNNARYRLYEIARNFHYLSADRSRLLNRGLTLDPSLKGFLAYLKTLFATSPKGTTKSLDRPRDERVANVSNDGCCGRRG